MNRGLRTALSCALLLGLAPAVTRAQSASSPAAGASAPSNLWLVAGGTFATVRGDCQACEEDTPYRHAGSVLAAFGYRINSRMDGGAEVSWIPVETNAGHVRTTHVDAVAQFRPWESKGFFLKGGAGMAFVRNWVDAVGPNAVNSKALSVVIGAGWAFRPTGRLGLQVFGSQHAGAIGDLQTGVDAGVQDVMANFWSLGAAVVVR